MTKEPKLILPYDYEVEYIDAFLYCFDTGIAGTEKSRFVVGIDCRCSADTGAGSPRDSSLSMLAVADGTTFDRMCGVSLSASKYDDGIHLYGRLWNDWSGSEEEQKFEVSYVNYRNTNRFPNRYHAAINVELRGRKVYLNGKHIYTGTKSTEPISTAPAHVIVNGYQVGTDQPTASLYARLYTIEVQEVAIATADTPATEPQHWYPVVKDGTPMMYCLESGELRSFIQRTPGSMDPSVEPPFLKAGPVCHTHDHLFDDLTKTLGRIPGTDIVLTDFDYSVTFHSLKELPNANTTEYGAVVLSEDNSGYVKGQALFKVKTSSGYAWRKVGVPLDGAEPPFNVRAQFLSNGLGGGKAMIRWQDPVYDDSNPNEPKPHWKYTRLIRKLGGYPSSIHDGVIVADNSQHNFYNDRQLIDELPDGISGTWYYRLFSVSEDGIAVTSTECSFLPIELDWKNLHTYLQQGKGPLIFGIGDVIVLDNGNDQMEFVVAGFDNIQPTLAEFAHSVTLVSRYMPTTAKFDAAWTGYHTVDDEVVISGAKIYYVKSEGGYSIAKPQPAPGRHLVTEDGYYFQVPESETDRRSTRGANIWSNCELRKWMNALNEYEYTLTNDTVFDPNKSYYRLDADGAWDLYTERPVGGNPTILKLYERGAKIEFKASDIRPPLVRIRSLDKDFFHCLISAKVTSAVARVYRGVGGAKSQTVDDRVYLPSVTELTGAANADVIEGTLLPFFNDEANWKRQLESQAGTFTYTPAWLRSPQVNEGTTTARYAVQIVTDRGNLDITDVSTQGGTNFTEEGVTLVLNLG